MRKKGIRLSETPVRLIVDFMKISREIEREYRSLLGGVDAWFSRCLEAGGTAFSCRGGCSACCRGLFDITLLDAVTEILGAPDIVRGAERAQDVAFFFGQ